MSDKLKPCPFCGKTDTLRFEKYKLHEEWWCYFVCTECIMTGPVRNSKKDAVEAWNRRAENA